MAVLDAAPGRAAVVAAVHAAMVLLVEAVGAARRERQVVHALAELGITLSLGQKIAARARIARTPGFAAVLRVKHTDRGDADPEATHVGGIGNDGVQHKADPARLPLRARGVSAQTLHLAKTLAAIAADKKPRRLDADVQPPVRGMSHPGALHRRLALGVSQPLARMGPGCATVIRLPHSRPEPRVAAGRVNGPVCEVGGDVGQRPVLAQGPTHAPIAALAVAFENERALLGPDQHPDIHGRPPAAAPRRPLGSRARQDRAAGDSPGLTPCRPDLLCDRRRRCSSSF